MFCPNCGNTVTDGLKYCKSCGGRLGKDDDKLGTPGKMLDGILETLFWFAVLSFGLLIGLVSVLLGKGVPPQLVVVVALGYLATVFGICFFLARQVPKLIDAKLIEWNGTGESRSSAQLAPRTTAQLDEYRAPAMSVTDHTTKTLDKVPLKKD